MSANLKLQRCSVVTAIGRYHEIVGTTGADPRHGQPVTQLDRFGDLKIGRMRVSNTSAGVGSVAWAMLAQATNIIEISAGHLEFRLPAPSPFRGMTKP